MLVRSACAVVAAVFLATGLAGPAHAASAPKDPFDLTAVGDGVSFVAGSGDHQQLWHSDGTSAGTRRLTDVHQDDGFCCVGLTPWGDRLLAEINDTDGTTAWVSDGTRTGTQPLLDIPDGSFGYWIEDVTPAGDHAYFWTGGAFDPQQVWETDGTAEGTTSVASFAGHVDIVGVLDDSLLVAGWDGGAAPGVLDRIAADGTVTQLAELPGAAYAVEGSAGGRYYLVSGGALFSTDGTAAGTTQVTDPGTDRIEISSPVYEVDGHALFFTYVSPTNYAAQLWTSDGTLAGTHRVTDTVFTESPRGPEAAVAGGHLVFRGSEAHPNAPALWSSDGTAEGTVRLDSPDLAHIPQPTDFQVVDDSVYVIARDAGLRAGIFRTDGASVTEVVPGHGDRDVALDALTVVGDSVAWTRGGGGTSHRRLWTTDGTTAGTHEIRPSRGWLGVGRDGELAAVGDRLYVAAAAKGARHATLWRSNLTTVHQVVSAR
ncbi:hypothetical protein [Nocardioides mangrovi]|uniref:PQQ-binding-like beta-propeller repeat protein n=1 Tax=Nocardioides mangrovi TaxID=2874580 RepID=A0ABS7U6J7_9ACTN|nr:hypothetical protein [Nocardioides mangrovi]MBZ5736601.1 hypothetical protein [Nocardioides mangrovi]